MLSQRSSWEVSAFMKSIFPQRMKFLRTRGPGDCFSASRTQAAPVPSCVHLGMDKAHGDDRVDSEVKQASFSHDDLFSVPTNCHLRSPRHGNGEPLSAFYQHDVLEVPAQ